MIKTTTLCVLSGIVCIIAWPLVVIMIIWLLIGIICRDGDI